MTEKVDDIVKDVLALSAAERKELLRLLNLQLIAGGDSPAIEQAWTEETERRVAAMDRGEAERVPAAAASGARL